LQVHCRKKGRRQRHEEGLALGKAQTTKRP
jgi:hypothetical protein